MDYGRLAFLDPYMEAIPPSAYVPGNTVPYNGRYITEEEFDAIQQERDRKAAIADAVMEAAFMFLPIGKSVSAGAKVARGVNAARRFSDLVDSAKLPVAPQLRGMERLPPVRPAPEDVAGLYRSGAIQNPSWDAEFLRFSQANRGTPTVREGTKTNAQGRIDRRTGRVLMKGSRKPTEQQQREVDVMNSDDIYKAAYENWFNSNPDYIQARTPAQQRDAGLKMSEQYDNLNVGRYGDMVLTNGGDAARPLWVNDFATGIKYVDSSNPYTLRIPLERSYAQSTPRYDGSVQRIWNDPRFWDTTNEQLGNLSDHILNNFSDLQQLYGQGRNLFLAP